MEEYLVEYIAAGAAQRDAAWEFIVKNWHPKIVDNAIRSGWTPSDADKALSRTIVRINKLAINEKFRLRTGGQHFYTFLQQAVVDEIIMEGLRSSGADRFFEYIRSEWYPDMKTELFGTGPLHNGLAAIWSFVLTSALSGLQYRIINRHLSLNQDHLKDYLFDELLIACIKSGDPSDSCAFRYIQTNWFDYLTSMIYAVNDPDVKTATFNRVIQNLWKRVVAPAREEPLVLDHRLKTYLYRAMINEYPRQKKALSEVTEILHLHVRNQKPDEEDDDPGIANDESRWAAYNLSPRDRLIVIGQLKDRCRQIFLLDADGFKDIEIAEQLGIATKYVKNKRWKCNKQIENFIKHLLDQKK